MEQELTQRLKVCLRRKGKHLRESWTVGTTVLQVHPSVGPTALSSKASRFIPEPLELKIDLMGLYLAHLRSDFLFLIYSIRFFNLKETFKNCD